METNDSRQERKNREEQKEKQRMRGLNHMIAEVNFIITLLVMIS